MPARTEVSFDVDGRFAHLAHVAVKTDAEGTIHVVYVLRTTPEPEEAP